MADIQIELGYIRLFRKFLKWEWFDDINTCHLFLYCLLRANHKDTTWRGIEIKKGSFLTSLENLAVSTGLTVKQVRTALNKLKATNELASKSTNKYSIITVNNWDLYQEEGKQKDKQKTNEGQAEGKQRATDNNDNNDNKYIEEEESKFELLKNWYGSEYKNVYLTDKEYGKLLNEILDQKALDELIEVLSCDIAVGKVANWSKETPHIHYEKLRRYWKFRRQNPNRFKQPAQSSDAYVPIYSEEIED